MSEILFTNFNTPPPPQKKERKGIKENQKKISELEERLPQFITGCFDLKRKKILAYNGICN